MPLSLEDIFAFRSVSDVQLSPDGRRFAFVVGDNHTTLLELDGQYVHSMDDELSAASFCLPLPTAVGHASRSHCLMATARFCVTACQRRTVF